MEQNLREALAAALKLVSEQLSVDPEWSIRQLEGVSDVTLYDWYRSARHRAAGRERIALARRAAASPLAGADDFATLAHALADDEQLAEAALCMEVAARIDPRPEYYQFLASVYERAHDLPRAIGAIERSQAVSSAPPQLQDDEARIVTALRRECEHSPECALALWRHEGARAARVPGLVVRIALTLLHLARTRKVSR